MERSESWLLSHSCDASWTTASVHREEGCSVRRALGRDWCNDGANWVSALCSSWRWGGLNPSVGLGLSTDAPNGIRTRVATLKGCSASTRRGGFGAWREHPRSTSRARVYFRRSFCWLIGGLDTRLTGGTRDQSHMHRETPENGKPTRGLEPRTPSLRVKKRGRSGVRPCSGRGVKYLQNSAVGLDARDTCRHQWSTEAAPKLPHTASEHRL